MDVTLLSNGPLLPVDIVLAPAWWHANVALTFDEDFFFDPARRVEVERKMEQVLYDRWGGFGLGEDRDRDLPVVGAVHLAAGFLLSEMLGCEVRYTEDAPPQVICAEMPDLNISADSAFKSEAFAKFERLTETLRTKYGYLVGDVNWGGILNIALDLRGQALFMDMFDRPDELKRFLGEIAKVIEKFTQPLAKETGTTSISVNRSVRHLDSPVYLHSECSHTMISVEDYEKFLFEYDSRWCEKYRPFGIHFCGKDPQRYAEAFAGLGHLDLLDVGWGGDISKLRKALPDTFLNIRLSPVEIIEQSIEQVEETIRRLAAESGNAGLTGICCINMDEKVTDEKITAIFRTVESLRLEHKTNL